MDDDTKQYLGDNSKKLSYVVVFLSLAVGMLFGFGA